jgi:hypothetical protein
LAVCLRLWHRSARISWSLRARGCVPTTSAGGRGLAYDPMWPHTTLTVYGSVTVAVGRAAELRNARWAWLGSNLRLLPCEGALQGFRVPGESLRTSADLAVYCLLLSFAVLCCPLLSSRLRWSVAPVRLT